jgi:hypothetical protein
MLFREKNKLPITTTLIYVSKEGKLITKAKEISVIDKTSIDLI